MIFRSLGSLVNLVPGADAAFGFCLEITMLSFCSVKYGSVIGEVYLVYWLALLLMVMILLFRSLGSLVNLVPGADAAFGFCLEIPMSSFCSVKYGTIIGEVYLV